MAVGPCPRADAEAASVKEVENWEVGDFWGFVEAEVELVVVVEKSVFPDDGGVVVEGNVEGQGVRAADGAVAEYLEDALEVFHKMRCGFHFRKAPFWPRKKRNATIGYLWTLDVGGIRRSLKTYYI